MEKTTLNFLTLWGELQDKMETQYFKFKKESKILGVSAGYYFKGEFLSRYQNEAIKILRGRIEEAGSKVGDSSKTNWEKGKEILKDEFEVIDTAFRLCTMRIKKTHDKKKPYYAKIHRRVLERKIETLKNRIWDVDERLARINNEFQNKKLNLLKEIEEIEKQLENGKE